MVQASNVFDWEEQINIRKKSQLPDQFLRVLSTPLQHLWDYWRLIALRLRKGEKLPYSLETSHDPSFHSTQFNLEWTSCINYITELQKDSQHWRSRLWSSSHLHSYELKFEETNSTSYSVYKLFEPPPLKFVEKTLPNPPETMNGWFTNSSTILDFFFFTFSSNLDQQKHSVEGMQIPDYGLRAAFAQTN